MPNADMKSIEVSSILASIQDEAKVDPTQAQSQMEDEEEEDEEEDAIDYFTPLEYPDVSDCAVTPRRMCLQHVAGSHSSSCHHYGSASDRNMV